MVSKCSNWAYKKAEIISEGRKDEPTSTQPYLLTSPRKICVVGAFFPDDFRATGEALVVDDQRAAFAGDDVFGFVEGETAEVPDAAQRRRPL